MNFRLTAVLFGLVFLVGIVLLVRTTLGGKFPNVSHPLSIGALAFLLIAFVGQVTAVSPALAWFWFDYFARLVIVSLLTVTLVDTRQKLFLTVAVMAITSVGFFTRERKCTASITGQGKW